jgi:hypothetical protein
VVKVGRPKKAAINSVVWVHSPRYGAPFYGVVIAYRTEVKGPRYLLIETDKQGREPHGRAAWHEAGTFEPTGRKSMRPGRIYRKNEKLGGAELRGCWCQCCEHVAGIEPEPDE